MKRSIFFAIRSAGKLLECLRIQKVNAFKHLVQNRSNAEKTADYIRDDGDNSRTDVFFLNSAFGLKARVVYTGCWLKVF